MEIFPLLQAKLMLLCFFLGVLSGLAFDLLRTVADTVGNRFVRLSATLTFVSDVLTVTLMGISVTVLCFYFNKGRFRFFCVLGLALGLAFYFFAFSKIFLRLYSLIFKAILQILLIFLRPTIKIIKKIRRNLQIVLYYTLKTLAKWTFWVYNIYVKKYVVRKAENGFIARKKDGGGYGKKDGN